jgi:hypothetical protein
MREQAYKFRYLPLLAAGIAAAVVSGIAIASLAIFAEGGGGAVASAEAYEAVAKPAVSAASVRAHPCAECGVIESTREIKVLQAGGATDALGRISAGSRAGIEAVPLRSYEITIRMRDGSMRVIRDAKPAKWKYGERVSIIAGSD